MMLVISDIFKVKILGYDYVITEIISISPVWKSLSICWWGGTWNIPDLIQNIQNIKICKNINEYQSYIWKDYGA